MIRGFSILTLFLCTNLFGYNSDISVGDTAPPISLFKLDNNKYFRSKELVGDKNLVISFFATWCVPCAKEIPELMKMSSEYGNDFQFMLIDVNEKKNVVKKHVAERGITLQVVLDKYGKVFKSFGGESLPLLVVIDKKGIISYYHNGYEKGDEKKLRKHLNSL